MCVCLCACVVGVREYNIRFLIILTLYYTHTHTHTDTHTHTHIHTKLLLMCFSGEFQRTRRDEGKRRTFQGRKDRQGDKEEERIGCRVILSLSLSLSNHSIPSLNRIISSTAQTLIPSEYHIILFLCLYTFVTLLIISVH